MKRYFGASKNQIMLTEKIGKGYRKSQKKSREVLGDSLMDDELKEMIWCTRKGSQIEKIRIKRAHV